MEQKKDRIIVICGLFDPIRYNELNLIKECKKRGDIIIVGLYSDKWLTQNKGGFYETYETRHAIVSSIKYVTEVFSFDDEDGTVCNLLNLVKGCYPYSDITFLSEVDMYNMPETKIKGITFEKI